MSTAPTERIPPTYAPQSTAEPSTGEQAKDKAQEAAGQAKEKAGAQLRAQVDQRSTEAGDRVSGIASDVRSVSEQLREQGKDQPAKLAEQAADRAERLGGYLRDNDADRILGDVEDFGRRQPWAVIAGGVAVGFLASRFLKASSTRRYDQRSTEAGDRVSGIASDVRSVSEQLREQGKDQPAKLAGQAADRAEQLGAYLQRSDADRILNDVEDFGRRRPWAVIAGGMALGIVASRFLKASSSTRYEQRSSHGDRQLPARTPDTTPADPPAMPPAYDSSSFEGSR